MKESNKKQYSFPQISISDMEKSDLLSISTDAYDDDVFDPMSWGKQMG